MGSGDGRGLLGRRRLLLAPGCRPTLVPQVCLIEQENNLSKAHCARQAMHSQRLARTGSRLAVLGGEGGGGGTVLG